MQAGRVLPLAPQNHDQQKRREVDARDGYARWASSYAPGRNPLIAVEEPRANELLAGLTVTAALDAGAGTGRHALALARRGIPVVALDQSPEMLAVVERAALEDTLPVETVVASLDAPLPLPDGRALQAAMAMLVVAAEQV